MQALLRNTWQDDDGQDLVEYALIAGLVSVICWAAIQATGQSISTIWNNVMAGVQAAAGA